MDPSGCLPRATAESVDRISKVEALHDIVRARRATLSCCGRRQLCAQFWTISGTEPTPETRHSDV